MTKDKSEQNDDSKTAHEPEGGEEEKRKKREGRVLGRKGWLHVDLVRGCHETAGSVS